jgi:hypothetical protein
MEIEVEADTQKELFRQVASAYEVFAEPRCGLCGKEDLQPSYRTVTKGKKSYEYAEWVCTNPKCRARLSLGTSNDEAAWLFPIRKLTAEGKPHRETGSHGPHNGWTKYRGEPKEEAA